jgi:CubicO group peptidase (beta-lactamase class C family)
MNPLLSRRQALAGLGALVGGSLLEWQGSARAGTALEDAFDKLVRKQGFTADGPGLAVQVRHPGGLFFQRCCGLANLADHVPVTPHTMFELASVSKIFTATAVLILHDRHQLSVLDDVRKHVPELPAYRKDRPIRITDLLQHVSGLPDYLAFEDVPRHNTGYWVNDDYVAELARQETRYPQRFPAGQKYEYQNTNYLLLAVVIARVTGQSFGTFLREAVLGPAGMKNSFVYESPSSVPKQPATGCLRAVGYEKEKGGWQPAWGAPPARDETLLTVGDGGVWTNLEDLDAWDRTLRQGKLVRPLSMRLALTPSETRDGKINDYGRGWSLYFGEAGDAGAVLKGYGHDGSWGGFRTSYYRDLLADRTTVLLSNRGTFDPDKFWYALQDVVEKHG